MTSGFRLGAGLSLDGERIYLRPGLRLLPGTTIAPVHLSSCVPALLASTEWVGSSGLHTESGIPLATLLQHGRSHGGAGISTSCASTTPFGLALAPDLPWED